MTYDPRASAFRVSSQAVGFDHQRSQIDKAYGVYVADINATFLAGQLVMLNSEQRMVICNGTNPFGFSKYNKANTLYASVFGERIQLNGTTATNLKHANLFVPGTAGGVRVSDDEAGTTVYTEGGGADYTVNYVNGQITRVGTGTIGDGDYVYVNYSYAMNEQDMDFFGRNFYNMNNDVDIQNGRVTVVNGKSTIWTSQYDQSETYAVNDKLYAGATADNLDGIVTKKSTGALIGRVYQVPTATDPFLGIDYIGSAVS